MIRNICSWILLAAMASGLDADASEFRAIRPIMTPQRAQAPGQAQPARWAPVQRKKVVDAVKEVIAAWNENRVEDVLDERFYDRSRLSDAMQGKVPRDARLEPLAIGEVQTLSREEVDTPEGRMMRSTVMVTVKTQVTYNDPQQGYQRRQGVNTYVLTITEPEEPEENGD